MNIAILTRLDEVAKALPPKKYWQAEDRIIFNAVKYALIDKLESELKDN